MTDRLDSPDDYLKRYPRICAHIIAESLGYATPTTAAKILKDAKEGRENGCEWIASCYRCNPHSAVERAIRLRAHHRGDMAEYRVAIAIVKRQLDSGESPLFASWF
ncbi:MAG: hypothetical protein FLDDKLPJ_03611 [Phycisphaerae bacterium]|nr:hypothetical protein [Phycisphaerae bacterium]